MHWLITALRVLFEAFVATNNTLFSCPLRAIPLPKSVFLPASLRITNAN